MKTLMLALAFALAATSASAGVSKGGKYDLYRLNFDENKAVTVKFSTVYETSDSCNHFGLSGSLRTVEVPEGTQTVQQDFVADFAVFGTEIACPPMDGTRKIALESKEFVIKPAYGRIYATILVPSNFKLSVK